MSETLETWECPACGFTFWAEHVDVATGEHSCPACAELDLSARLQASEQARERYRAVAQAVSDHYSASLDYQPPYVRMARAALSDDKAK